MGYIGAYWGAGVLTMFCFNRAFSPHARLGVVRFKV